MRHGFSLVELSIVLVILGLLVGGILAGQSLIRAAELRSASTEYAGYRTVTQAFRDKYFAVPGDMTNATSFWGKDNTNCSGHTGTAAANGTCNGNGNGIADIACGGAACPSENYQFWKQLNLAGLVEGAYTGLGGASAYESVIATNVPRSKLSSAGWTVYAQGVAAISTTVFFEGDYSQFYFYGAAVSTSQTFGAALKPEEAWNIDTKLDDGKPGTGIVRVREDQGGCHNAGTSTTVALAGTAAYALSTNSLQCALIFTY